MLIGNLDRVESERGEKCGRGGRWGMCDRSLLQTRLPVFGNQDKYTGRELSARPRRLCPPMLFIGEEWLH